MILKRCEECHALFDPADADREQYDRWDATLFCRDCFNDLLLDEELQFAAQDYDEEVSQ